MPLRNPAPLVYEINTRCWLRERSEASRKPLTLATVARDEFDHWTRSGITHVWLMGVWRTAPASVAFSRKDPALRRKWSRLLPGFSERDITGSAYALGGYETCASLGGDTALQAFRDKLNRAGMKLLLDFIPNHTGLDHPRVPQRPECYINYPEPHEGAFRAQTATGERWIAHGKDPYFPAWADTAQLDLRNPHTREALIDDLLLISGRCDGVRCDMSMLVLNEVFERNWPAASPTPWEFWPEAIAAVKKKHPEFLFLAEVYWDLEPRLLELGFDYVYDKRAYDLLIARKPADLQQLLSSRSPEFLHRTCHFLENHDEARIASLLSPGEHRAAAQLMFALPGMRLLHECQLTGAKVRASVHLNRRPREAADAEIASLYSALLPTMRNLDLGTSTLLRPTPAWHENPTSENIIAVQGELRRNDSFDLFAVNLAPHASQCRVHPAMPEHPSWFLRSLLSTESHLRSGPELLDPGLYLDLPAHTAQAFRFTPFQSGT